MEHMESKMQDHYDAMDARDVETRRTGMREGLLRAMTILHDASVQHYADAVASKKIVESEGHTFAARLLQSYANGMEIEAGNVK